MFNFNITQRLSINTTQIKNIGNTQTKTVSSNNINTKPSNSSELSVEHDESSTPLTPEQIEAKQSAKQKAILDIEKAKRANSIITKTDKTERGSYIIETKYDALGNEEKITVKREDGSICQLDEFNNGVISKTQMFYPDGRIAGDIEYNNQGKPLIEKSYSPEPDESGKINGTIDYEYYENGNLKSMHQNMGINKKEEQYYENGNPKFIKSNNLYEEYNEKGQLTKSGITNLKTGKDVSTRLYEYDDLGRVIKETYTHSKEETHLENGTVEISYDGDVKKSVYKNSTGQVKQIRTEKTLSDGLQRECVYSPDGVLRTEHISSFDETTELLSSKTTIYDKTGQMIGYVTGNRVEYTENDGAIIGIEFKYYNEKGENISEEEYYKLYSEKSSDFMY